MFILGICSLLQMLYLPGAIVVSILQPKTRFIQKIVCTVGLSLVINYVLVLILTLLHIYLQGVVIAIFVIEAAALIWLSRKKLMVSWGSVVGSIWHSVTSTLKELLSTENRDNQPDLNDMVKKVLIIISLCFALIAIFWMIRIFISSIGTVFNGWDSVVAWNRWAGVWAANQLPMNTHNYPQLVPINWSLTYVYMGTTQVQLFAKLIMPLFPLLILLLMLDIGFKEKSFSAFLGTFLSYYIFKHFLGEEMVNGYVDFVVAFFAFLTIYILMLVRDTQEKREKTLLLTGAAIFAAGSAVSKQAGIYVLLLFPIFGYFVALKQKKVNIPKEFWKILIFAWLLAIIIASPWYVFKQITFLLQSDFSEITPIIQFTANAGGNLPLFQQILSALKSLDHYLWFLVLLIPAFFVIKPKYRIIALSIVFPFTLLWSYVASYDYRNLSLMFPFLGLLTGLGIEGFLQLFLRFFKFLKYDRWKVVVFPIAIILLVVAGNFIATKQRLIDQQITLQKQIFSPEKNDLIYEIINDNGKDTKILTNYPIRELPGLEDNQVSFWYDDLQTFISSLNDPSIRFILVPSYANPAISDYIDQMINAKELTLIFRNEQWITYEMYKINR